MNIVGLPYFIFLIVLVIFYWQISRRQQNLLLLIASYFFYAFWDVRFLSIILVVTILNFFFGHKIYNSTTFPARKFWLILCLLINLGILGYFKYTNFFLHSLVDFFHLLGWHISYSLTNIVLPLGLSFYIFQSLSYPLDIYNQKMQPTGSFLEFATFVAFFPKIIAGPIVRARDFLFQLRDTRNFHGKEFQEGCIRILTGYFKKAFIADTLSIYLVSPVFENPATYGTRILWLAMFGYAVQIYADFSGYSSMAIGAAQILGLKIPENFLFPGLAASFSDFWRRWHITMSTFFRDYVYIPLGGNRSSQSRVFFNLEATMLICGLWHGAAWTFVLWGGLHGIYLILNHLFEKKPMYASKKTNKSTRELTPAGLETASLYPSAPLPGLFISEAQESGVFVFFHRPGLIFLFQWLFVQLLICFAWILFRADNFKAATIYFKGLLGSEGHTMIEIPFLIWCAFIAFFIDHLYGWIKENRANILGTIPDGLFAFVYACMIVFLFHALPDKTTRFIYFQF